MLSPNPSSVMLVTLLYRGILHMADALKSWDRDDGVLYSAAVESDTACGIGHPDADHSESS